MQTLTVYETHDGQLHRTHRDAVHHLEKKLGDVMLPLAKRLAAAEKYSRIVDLLNAETETLRTMVRIQDDIKTLTEDLND